MKNIYRIFLTYLTLGNHLGMIKGYAQEVWLPKNRGNSWNSAPKLSVGNFPEKHQNYQFHCTLDIKLLTLALGPRL